MSRGKTFRERAPRVSRELPEHQAFSPGDLVSEVISRVKSTLNGVTLITTLLMTDLLSPLGHVDPIGQMLGWLRVKVFFWGVKLP